ncbi:MAG: hypothetical protein ACRDD7_09465 [Peptostreptococcaceae bacterium]
MPLSELVVNLAIQKSNYYQPDTSLLDAIVEMDQPMVRYLVNRVYREEVMNVQFISEKLNMRKMVQLLENKLDHNRINVIH